MTPAATTFSAMLENRQDEQLLALAAEAPNRCDSDRETPLEAAVKARRADLCRRLLDLGCDPDFSRTGTDPLERCLQLPGEPPLDILALLLERSRHPVDDQRSSGATLLHGAVAWGCLAAVPFLMSRGARLSDMDIDCETVAQTALETGGEPLLARLREMEAAEGAEEPAP
jgi:ankyrin repeat protein